MRKCQSASLNFWHIFLNDLLHVRFFRAEFGSFGVCIGFCHKLRMVDVNHVQCTAESLSDHLLEPVKSRDEHNYCRAYARTSWSYSLDTRLSRVDISADYAKQAFIPVVSQGTMSDYFAQRQGLNVNTLGIYNEGSGEQTTFLSTEGARHNYNAVCSQLNYYFSSLFTNAGDAEEV